MPDTIAGGYYWIAIRRADGSFADPEIAQFDPDWDGPGEGRWHFIGDWRKSHGDELKILSPRLEPPSA
jgi:hypothetical protein